MYKLQNAISLDGQSTEPVAVIRLSDNATIPFDPANMDFVEYNKWLALGNQPLPPDEPTLP